MESERAPADQVNARDTAAHAKHLVRRYCLKAFRGLMIAGCFMGLTELALRAGGCAPKEPDESPLLIQHLDFSPVHRLQQSDMLAFMPMGRANPAARWTTTVPATPAGLRVITLGGSATYGLPYTPFASFSGRLERSLVEGGAGIPVEVINMGMCSLGSMGVVTLAERALEAAQPNLIIVYSGNNEFLDRAAMAQLVEQMGPTLALLEHPLGRLHSYRALRSLLRPEVVRTAPTVGTPTINEALEGALGEKEHRFVRWRYQANLERVVASAKSKGVPILLVTVPSNVRDGCLDCAKEEISATAEEYISRLRRHAGERGDAQAVARDGLEHLEDEADLVAVGNALLEVGDEDGARAILERAELVTAHPFRGNHQLRDTVRQVGARLNVPVCDAARAFELASPAGIPGRTLFRDECHPNAKGHGLIAKQILACILREQLLPLGPRMDLVAAKASATHPTKRDDQGCVWRLDYSLAESRTNTSSLHPSASPCTVAEAGHQDFMAGAPEMAKARYEQALKMGAPEGWMHWNIALVARYAGSPESARDHLAAAQRYLENEPVVQNMVAVSELNSNPIDRTEVGETKAPSVQEPR